MKHLADCLDLHAKARLKLGLNVRLGLLHAMKVYTAVGAMRSATRVGQDAVDQLLELNNVADARYVMESLLMPLVKEFRLLDLYVQVRAQYAVVLAYCGELDPAMAEVSALEAYDLSPERRYELANQRALIGRIARSNRRLRTERDS